MGRSRYQFWVWDSWVINEEEFMMQSLKFEGKKYCILGIIHVIRWCKNGCYFHCHFFNSDNFTTTFIVYIGVYKRKSQILKLLHQAQI